MIDPNQQRGTPLNTTAMPYKLTEQAQKSLINYNHLTYLLYLLSFFTAGLSWVIPIIMNYMKRSDADSTWLASHFDWQIKTFWYSIVLGGVGVTLILFSLGGLGLSLLTLSQKISAGSMGFMLVGLLILGITYIWHLYRIVKGWIALCDKRPVP